MTIKTYREEGSTTTPFDMVIRNRCSRYNIAQMAIEGGAKHNETIRMAMKDLLQQVIQDMTAAKDYVSLCG